METSYFFKESQLQQVHIKLLLLLEAELDLTGWMDHPVPPGNFTITHLATHHTNTEIECTKTLRCRDNIVGTSLFTVAVGYPRVCASTAGQAEVALQVCP